MTQSLMLKSEGIPPYSFLSIVIAAGVVAKVLLLLDHLPFINAFSQKPLIWTILWQSSLYGIGSLLIRFILRVTPFIIKHRSLELGFKNFLQVVDLTTFLGIQLWYILLFFTFVSTRELILTIGTKRVLKVFLGIKTAD